MSLLEAGQPLVGRLSVHWHPVTPRGEVVSQPGDRPIFLAGFLLPRLEVLGEILYASLLEGPTGDFAVDLLLSQSAEPLKVDAWQSMKKPSQASTSRC